MDLYHSTRNRDERVSARRAVRQGIAADGGLFVPEEKLLTRPLFVPGELADLSYQDIALRVLQRLLPDFGKKGLRACVEAAYTGTFASPEVAPAVPLGDGYALELFHGPTCAFKDIALQMLPQLMARACVDAGEKGAGGASGRDDRDAGTQANGRDGLAGTGIAAYGADAEHPAERALVLVATSGDTGKAALAGFADVPGTGVVVFYPAGKVSDVQRLQMATQLGGNVAVCAVRGTFDDAQTAVKRAFADAGLTRTLRAQGFSLTSANSINIGRLAPQVAYYFAAYAQLLRAGALAEGQAVEFCVPTGNFGNVLAGYYAKLLGLPISRLVVASNANNVLADFLSTGTYDRNRPFHATISPSMDILVSSNLERMLYHLSNGNCELVAHLMAELDEKGSYRVPHEVLERIQDVFACGYATDAQARSSIRHAWDEDGYLLDPHSACGYHVMRELGRDGGSAARVLLCTASPYKFPAAVAGALGIEVPADGFACMCAVQERTGVPAPQQLVELEHAAVRFTDEIGPEAVLAYVERVAGQMAHGA